ncbi:cytochrome ubiquinol oxidase subunit I, partial [Francisella tularensis subsp. holarctica]|uniref:cytochrome ubiquinol oxidase subunit I n=1 Tax=Francisella tularensis TaxID=263 RepID=UPI002381C29B
QQPYNISAITINTKNQELLRTIMFCVEFISRLQFAFPVSFHILFPAFSIVLSTFLMIFEALWLILKYYKYLAIVKF